LERNVTVSEIPFIEATFKELGYVNTRLDGPYVILKLVVSNSTVNTVGRGRL
jgi:hypothetical protein